MSDAPAILDRCRRAGLHVWREGERISIAPARLCPPDLLETIRNAKPQLLEWLADADAHRLAPDCAPWLHVARQIVSGEFDGGDRSLLESLLIGVRNIPHPACQSAKARLQALLGRGKESRP